MAEKKSKIYKWLEQRLYKEDALDGRSGFKHSMFFHKHYRGYSEIRVPNEKGGFTIKRVYTAPWYRHQITDLSWVLLKALYGLGAIGAAIALCVVMSANVMSNYIGIVGGVECLSIIAFVVLLAQIVMLECTPRKMTIGECDQVDKPLTRWALISFITFCALIASKIFAVFFYIAGDFSEEWKSLLVIIPICLITLAIFICQKKMSYEQMENLNSVDENDETYEVK